LSTFGIVHRFPGGTKEQYDASVAEVHPAGGLPEGQTYHAAGATDDGDWIVIALWDSRDSWDRFNNETLMPGFEKLGDRGLPGPPQQTTFEIHREELR
jgi:hypothetical protein